MSSQPEQRCRILLVDDDQRFRSGIRRTLALGGTRDRFDIVEVSNGAGAMAALAGETMDCVLLDYQMPGGDGLEWLAQILKAHPDTAVVMVTGDGSEAVAVRAMQQGAMDYLVKGAISPEALNRALSNAVEKVHLRRAVADQQRQLIEAEKQRVMIQSLGAACHHIAQPATVIAAYLHIMQQKDQTQEMRMMLENCLVAVEQIEGILKRLQAVSTYRTEPYLPAGGNEPSRPDEFILAI